MRRLGQSFVLLEDRLTKACESWLFTAPDEIVACEDAASLGDSWSKVQEGLARGLHAAGFLSFELGYCLEPKLRPLLPLHRSVPLFWFGLFRDPLRLTAKEADALFAATAPPRPVEVIEAEVAKGIYLTSVEGLLERIAAGEVYQVNLTFPLDFRYEGDPLTLYAGLRARQPVGYGALIGLPDLSILSVSPELFVEVAAGMARSRPMKGTVARDPDAAFDREAAAMLRQDPKQRAENLMIVDLLRNDLSRISMPASVRVPSLFDVETFPTIHTMTSTIESRLKPGTSLRDLVEALFPCGSVVGAPKHRGMELIRAIEDTPRGVYTGAIGVIRPDGDLSFNVAIRTAALCLDGRGVYGVGGGIVADSNPQAEWDECLLKARVLTGLSRDYGLIETLRWVEGEGFRRLEPHLLRLGNSARLLEFDFDLAALDRHLAGLAKTIHGGDRRVRIELRRSGAMEITTAPIGPAPDIAAKLQLSAVRLDAADPFLRHKTTIRDQYEVAYAAATAEGFDEAIMLNQYDEIADATRHSVFVEIGGKLLTPPVSSGALPGVLRQDLLDKGEAVERVLKIDDLAAEARWFIGNSLRGLRRAEMPLNPGG